MRCTGSFWRINNKTEVAGDCPVDPAKEVRAKESDELYVKRLYRALLGRAADSSGLTHWTNKLKKETREQVFKAIAATEECRKSCVKAYVYWK